MAGLNGGRPESDHAFDMVGSNRLTPADDLNTAGTGEMQGLLAHGRQVPAPSVRPVARLGMLRRKRLRDLARGDGGPAGRRNRRQDRRRNGVVLLFVFFFQAFGSGRAFGFQAFGHRAARAFGLGDLLFGT